MLEKFKWRTISALEKAATWRPAVRLRGLSLALGLLGLGLLLIFYWAPLKGDEARLFFLRILGAVCLTTAANVCVQYVLQDITAARIRELFRAAFVDPDILRHFNDSDKLRIVSHVLESFSRDCAKPVFALQVRKITAR